MKHKEINETRRCRVRKGDTQSPNDTRVTHIGKRTSEALAEIYHAERLLYRHSIRMADGTEERIFHGQS